MLVLIILHSIYITYVLRFLKTKYSLAHPATYFENKLLYHPIGISKNPRSPVCKLGNELSLYLSLFILIRGILIYNKYNLKQIKNITLIVLTLTITLSLLNLNVIFLLIPHFLIEYFFYFN